MTSGRHTIFPILDTLAAQYKLVLGLPFAAAVLTSVAVLLMRPTFASTASFVPENPAGPRLPAGLAGFAAQLGLNLGGEASRSPAFYADVLHSREVLGNVLNARVPGDGDSITVFALYRVEGDSPQEQFDDGLKTLRNHVKVSVDQRTNVVRVGVEGPSATAARDVANLLLARLADFNLNTRQSTAGERRRFIESRVTATEQELRAAEEALRAFYDRNRQWETSPHLRFEEQRLNRQVSVQQDIYLTLRREYELARVEEVNNTPLFTIIDRPSLPGRRIRPQRTFTVLLVTFVVGILACGIALLRQHTSDLLASRDPEYLPFHERFARLQRLFVRSSPHQ